MKVLSLRSVWMPTRKSIECVLQLVIVLLVWYTAPLVFELPQGNSIEIAKSIGLMLVLALVAFVVVIVVCWWLLNRMLVALALPGIGDMVLCFNELSRWEQIKVGFGLFALFVFAAVAVIVAVL
ncbi:hypothetical protein [Pedobacter frigoris]|uniref:Uncharacterized protein n=1 Tax=Pedobacter frigoris TaxID=2571272 RepID=A0A4U1CKC4_9SPHI|nr:hypothetical protein [Pedobacter frigoris]TKC07086.1 hypothetical protein FA047_07455 [Pedobacter frigoris]